MVYSELESKRFNMSIYRSKADDVQVSELRKQILVNNVDVLILRLPSSNKSRHYRLSSLGFPFIHADTLVYYQAVLSSCNVQNLRNNVDFEIVNEANVPELQAMIPVIFQDYQNHYYSNPYFLPSKISEGYIEWASSFHGDSGKVSWLVKKDQTPIGFATCSYDEASGDCEGVLYGVMPKYAGQGVYSDVIRFTQSYFKQKGFKRMWVSTQIQNYSVQKVWLREGFFLKNSLETYHVNSFLSSRREATSKSYNLNVSAEDITKFGQYSGDMNPIHFDPKYAIACGFDGPVAHGMIIQSFLSKIFGMEYPGHGTIIANNTSSFFGAIYPGREYRVTIDTYYRDEPKGLVQLVAKITDESEGRILFVSYNSLIKR